MSRRSKLIVGIFNLFMYAWVAGALGYFALLLHDLVYYDRVILVEPNKAIITGEFLFVALVCLFTVGVVITKFYSFFKHLWEWANGS